MNCQIIIACVTNAVHELNRVPIGLESIPESETARRLLFQITGKIIQSDTMAFFILFFSSMFLLFVLAVIISCFANCYSLAWGHFMPIYSMKSKEWDTHYAMRRWLKDYDSSSLTNQGP